MKLIKNEFEFRLWMTHDFLQLEEGLSPLYDPDLLQREITAQMPSEFPCIAYIVRGSSIYEPENAKFLYKHQVEEWAKIMGIVNA